MTGLYLVTALSIIQAFIPHGGCAIIPAIVKLSRYIAVIAVIVLLLVSFPGPPITAQPPPAGSKVTASLEMQVRDKVNYLQQASQPQDMLSPALKNIAPAEAAIQKVFLHFARHPTPAQLDDLRSLGIAVYPDSWIPPVGNRPTGFIYAEMPVSRLPDLVARDYLLTLSNAEIRTRSRNNVARQATGVNSVWDLGYYGAGVTVAVLDSGLDITHPDIPVPVASKDYSNYPVLGDAIPSPVSGHGTHVTGTVLGRGTQSAGLYRGIAPQANLVFLKIGNNIDANSTFAADVGAIKAAVDVYGAQVITMSYGEKTDYLDGTDEDSQAVDYAVSRGAIFFASAGNSAIDAQHYSATVAANTSTDFIEINNAGGTPDAILSLNMIWFDGPGIHRDLNLEIYDAAKNCPLPAESSSASESWKGTENRFFRLPGYMNSGSYYLKVRNNSSSDQSFHLYYDDPTHKFYNWDVTFANPDPFYTLGTPALADGAIAVGAYQTRVNWTDYQGVYHNQSSWVLDVAPPWSSRGPRTDPGAPGKPDIVAPGSLTISARDRYAQDTATGPDNDSLIIDNDGVNLNGSGPADYIAFQGTSMASPHAAGVAALLLSKNPYLTPAQVGNYLESTATDKGDTGRDNIYGWGLLNARAALDMVPIPGDVSRDGVVNASDITALAPAFNKRAGDAGFLPNADINNNGIVDIYDLVLIGLNFGRTT